MKSLIILLSLLIITFDGEENLVTNPGFNLKKKIRQKHPKGGILKNVVDWYSPSKATPDFFSEDVDNFYQRAYDSELGDQIPKIGSTYIGLILGLNFPDMPDYDENLVVRDYREYVQTELREELKYKQKYCVKFHWSLADNCFIATDALGLYISKDKVGNKYDDGLRYKPQISNPRGELMTDKKNWVCVSGVYEANGGEKYITIGSFVADNIVKSKYLEGSEESKVRAIGMSYYFIDDVSVVPLKDGEECDCIKEGYGSFE